MAMGRLVVVVLISLMTLVSTGGCDGRRGDREDIKNNFTAFFDAFAKRDGQAAAVLITNASLEWYKKVVDNAVTTPAEELLKMKPSLVYEILVVRLFAKPEDIKGLTGAQFFSRAVSRGWYHHELEEKHTLNRVLAFNGDIAEVQVKTDGVIDDLPWLFMKEDGYWKFDQDTDRDQDDRRLIRHLSEERMTLKEFFELYFEPIVGATRVKKMWDPMVAE